MPVKADTRTPSVADEWRASALSRLTWSWLYSLLQLGYSRPLELSDLGALDHQDEAVRVSEKLQSLLQLDSSTSSGSTSTPPPSASSSSSASPSSTMSKRLFQALLVHEPDMILAAIGKLLGDLLGFVGPLALAGIVKFVALKAAGVDDKKWGVTESTSLELGYWWLIALIFSSLFQNLCLHQHHHHAIRSGMHVRSAITVLVYKKALRLSSKAKEAFGAGFIQNIASSDANSLSMVYWFIHYAWAAPLQLAICMAMLYDQLGPSAFVGLAVLIALIPIQGKVASYTGKFSKQTMKHSDTRMKLMNEIITGIRIIKFMALEAAFSRRISKSRSEELKQKLYVAITYALSTTLMEIGPLAVALLSFLTYGYTSNEPLTASRAFSSLALFNILRLPLMVLPMLVGSLASARVSHGRIASFLDAPDMPEYRNIVVVKKEVEEEGSASDENDYVVKLEKASLRWAAAASASSSAAATSPSSASSSTSKAAAGAASTSTASKKATTTPDSVTISITNPSKVTTSASKEIPFILQDLDLTIPRGKLTCIVGAVGAGKSSLLAAILGEMGTLDSGKVTLRVTASDATKTCAAASGTSAISVGSGDAIAYCPQHPWILNASLRDNIIFGQVFDEERYARILDACALRPDLKILPDGDKTEIGERGVNLSGGQKARVALARAVYSTCPLVLLDDVLSAVDAHVANHLVEHVLQGELLNNISSDGGSKPRTVVLVTHQLQVVPKTDGNVVVMDNGKIVQCGNYQMLMSADAVASGGGSNLLRAMMQERGKIQEELTSASTSSSSVTATTSTSPTEKPATATASPPTPATKTVTTTTTATTTPASVGKLITEEDRMRGSVPNSIYTAYLKSFGGTILLFMVLTLLAVNIGRVGTDWWLGIWSTNTLSQSVGYYVGIHASITCATSLLTLGQMSSWAFGGIHAASALHESMFLRVIRAPTSFFDTTPVGRILNRFSGDISTIDKELPNSFSSFINLTFRIFATIVVQAVISPWTLLGVVPIMSLYLMVQQYYRHTSRELKRLDNITKSPVFAQLAETLMGLSTIRSYHVQERFIEMNQLKIDTNVKAFWKSNLVNRWLGLRLDWIGTLLVSVTALVAVFTAGSISPGLIGLFISYSLAITGTLNWLVRGATEAETYLASVERIQFYASLPVEAPAHTADVILMMMKAKVVEGGGGSGEDATTSLSSLPPIWPSQGALRIEDLTLRYRPELPPVLKNIHVNIEGGMKVGIVGRTGSGKSSLMLALFRMLEAEGGKIFIDDVDIAKIGLEDLRSKLAIIPQDPTLFAGSIRYNLDPLSCYKDEQIWAAIERVQLTKVIEKMGAGAGTTTTTTTTTTNDHNNNNNARSTGDLENAMITEGGENLSVGQRQLVCMARAILRNAKVLVLDEATASVDVVTDALIQTMVRDVFKDATVLTIAHRLNTVLDADRVLVLENGEKVEFDSPAALLSRPESAFAQLVRKSADAKKE